MAELDPIDAALSTQRKLAAAKILDRSVAETSTAAIEADNAKLKAEIEQQRLREEANSRKAGDGWREYMLETMRSLQEQLVDTQKALTEQQQAAMAERLAMLQDEIGRLRDQKEQAPPSAGTVVKQAISDAKEIMEQLAPVTIPPMPGAGDATLQVWLVRAQLDQERWREEREDRHREAMAKLDIERSLREKEITIQEQAAARQDRFMTETAPKLLEVGTNLLQQFMNRGGTQTGASVPAAELAVAPPAAATAPFATGPLPPGVVRSACPSCQHPLLYRETWPEVICQSCGAIYQLHAENPERTGRPPAETADEESGALV